MAPLGEDAVLVEPWRLMHLAMRPLDERVAAARAFPRISHRSVNAPFGSAELTVSEELEIIVQYMIWAVAAVLPLVAVVVLCLAPTTLSFALAGAVALSMVWPNRSWPVPPATRLEMPIRNRKIASAFIRYFPMRCIVEDDAMFDSRTPALFAGVPHGLFPIGFVLLGFCNFALPWRRIRAAAASVTLHLPVWRQVSLWNDGIAVSKKAITSALAAGDNVLVAMDGIAGMFAGRRHPGKETFLLKRRRGLVRIALQTGTPLVPFVCFGNTNAVEPKSDEFGLMEAISRLLGISLIYPAGRFLLPVPRRVPVTIVIGVPLTMPNGGMPIAEPTDAQVDELHERLIKELTAVYYRWRVAGGYGGVELEVV